jgi:hypothetical protein
MALIIIDGPHFKAGESVSDVIDVTAGRIIRITCSVVWTPAILTFMISTDGQSFNDVYDYHGQVVAINVVPGAAILVPEVFGQAAEYIKFRSGTPQVPVVQENDSNFAIAVLTSAAPTPSTAER